MPVIHIDGDGAEHISFFPSEDRNYSALVICDSARLYPEVTPEWWKSEERTSFRRALTMVGFLDRALGDHIESNTPNPKKLERTRVTRETKVPGTADEFWLPNNVYTKLCAQHSLVTSKLPNWVRRAYSETDLGLFTDISFREIALKALENE